MRYRNDTKNAPMTSAAIDSNIDLSLTEKVAGLALNITATILAKKPPKTWNTI